MSSSSSSNTSSIGSVQRSPAISSSTTPPTGQLSDAQRLLCIQDLQTAALQLRSHFLSAGIAPTYAKIEQLTILSRIATLVNAGVFSHFPGIAGSLRTDRFPFERLPNALYHTLTKFLPLSDTARMPLSRTLKHLTAASRAMTLALDLTDYSLVGENLQKALSLYPNITSLTVDNTDELVYAEDIFGPILQLKPLISLTLDLPRLWPRLGFQEKPDTAIKGHYTNEIWHQFVLNLDLSRMEYLKCPHIINPVVVSVWDQLGPKLSSSRLKFVSLINGPISEQPIAQNYLRIWLQSLPRTIEHLSLNHICLNNESIDIILERVNLEAMRSCDLCFDKVDPEKAQKLFERLPFSEMIQINLACTTRSPYLTLTGIQQIVVKLAENKQLKELTISTCTLSMDSFIPLIHALRSPLLSRFNLICTGSKIDFHHLMSIKYLIIQQSTFWDSNSSCDISDAFNSYFPCQFHMDGKTPKTSLCEARALFQAQDLLIEQIREAGENVTSELRQKQLLLASIEAPLGHLSRQTIIYHYTLLQNALDPDYPLKWWGTLEYYGNISNPPEDLSNLSPLALIRRLEELLQVEEKRLKNVGAYAMRGEDLRRLARSEETLKYLDCVYTSEMSKLAMERHILGRLER